MADKTSDTVKDFLEFDDNSRLTVLYGEQNAHLIRLEERLKISILAKGNTLVLKGDAQTVSFAKSILESLWQRAKQDLPVGFGEINAALKIALDSDNTNKEKTLSTLHDAKLIIKTSKRTVTARTPNQSDYIKKMNDYSLTFGIGPAGTGKTYIAVAKAVEMYQNGDVERIILCRPAVEAGERLGFLPGDMKEKVDPYFRPIYDSLHDLMGGDTMAKKIESGDIEIAPLAFMRGRTLSNAFIILDEAQNTTRMQMKMFLTRLGPNSHMVITGDQTQIDLPSGEKSGLVEAVSILDGDNEIGFARFNDKDVVRHNLVSKIIRAYEKNNA